MAAIALLLAKRATASEMNDSEFEQLLLRLSELHKCCHPDEPWWIHRIQHDYPDGTTHFSHVRQTHRTSDGEINVAIGDYLTPETAEMLVLMRNNLPELLLRSRLSLKVERDDTDHPVSSTPSS